MKKPKQEKPDQPGRKYEKPLSLSPLTFEEAVRRIALAKPIPKKAPKGKIS
ncbi:MAG TPA: hypothetical protein VK395_06755 [Gemmataceae bacterium]|nr:hypothetical protein [Gemmataceae bacterium]